MALGDRGAEEEAFTLVRPTDDEAYVGTLLYRGRSVGDIAGLVIDGQFAIEGGYWLLLATCDCPFEETLFIHLLDGDGRRLETLMIGEWYVPGFVEDIARLGPRSVGFHFPGKAWRHVATVDPHGRGFKLRIVTTDLETGRQRGIARRYFGTWGDSRSILAALAFGVGLLTIAGVVLLRTMLGQ